MSRIKAALAQLEYISAEIKILVNRRWWRWFTCWFGGSAGVILSYRLDRFFYLLAGKAWPVLRPFFFPLFLLLRLVSANHQIHYQADIGKGLRILHPVLGIVVSARTIAGEGLILTGGNCIGGRETLQHGDIRIGNHVSVGANAVILGPISIGDQVAVGAGAVVVHSAPNGVTLVGVPAKIIKEKTSL